MCSHCKVQEAKPGHRRCEACIAKQRERDRILREQGICDRCHKEKVIPGKSKCPRCDTWIKEYNKVWHFRVRKPRLTGSKVDQTPIIVKASPVVSPKPEVIVMKSKPLPAAPKKLVQPKPSDDIFNDPRWRGLFLIPKTPR